ncbi:MAG TPA: STAS domain-containing protein [Herpetosiphonaceae bacterium]
MAQWFDYYRQHEQEIVARITADLRRELPSYASLPAADVAARLNAALPPFAADLDDDAPHRFSDFWQALSYQRAQEGMPLAALLGSLMVGTQGMITNLKEAQAGDPEAQMALVEKAYAISAQGIAGVYNGYDQANQDVIAAQQSTLAEVSTPIVPIFEGILVLPIVGAVHSQRASQIMEALLEGISAHSADVVIMDITGVPVVDTGIANYLLQAARAARLLGSQVVLVGISAEIAQTIVQLGIDLSGITTRSNLQEGMAHALEVLGMGVRPLEA